MGALLTVPDGFTNLGPQGGFVAAYWVAGICLAIAAVGFGLYIGCRRRTGNDMYDSGGMTLLIIMSWLFGAIALIVGGTVAGFLIVQGPSYLDDYRVTGTVVSATNKFESGTGDLTSIGQPVVRLKDLQEPLFVDDDRVLGLVGESVTFRCHPVWRYHADAYWTCQIQTFR